MTFLKEHFDRLKREQTFEQLPDYQEVIRKAHIAAIERPRDPLEDLNEGC